MKSPRPHLSPQAFFQQWPGHTRVETCHAQPHDTYIGLFHGSTGQHHYLISASHGQRDDTDSKSGQAWLAVQLSPTRVDEILGRDFPLQRAYLHPEWDVVVKVTLDGLTVRRVEFVHPAYLSEEELPGYQG